MVHGHKENIYNIVRKLVFPLKPRQAVKHKEQNKQQGNAERANPSGPSRYTPWQIRPAPYSSHEQQAHCSHSLMEQMHLPDPEGR